MNNKTFDNFPLWMVLVCNAVSFGIYLTGAYVIFQIGAIWLWLYILFCLFQEFRIMLYSCIHCCYYGKFCGLGKGKIASYLFKRGDPQKFLEKKLIWKDLIPDLLVSLIPFLAGIYLLLVSFHWPILLAVIILVALTTVGNGYIRGNITCKYCRQRELGCPAEELFGKFN